jgi:hypothetical protein
MSTRASILVRTPRLASARVDEALCMCGSGRTHRRCHGLRGSERRHRGCELHALAELHDLALLFPSVRPKGAAIESFADRLAASMGDDPRDSTPAEVEEGYGCFRARSNGGSSACGLLNTRAVGALSAPSWVMKPSANTRSSRVQSAPQWQTASSAQAASPPSWRTARSRARPVPRWRSHSRRPRSGRTRR